MGLAETKCQRRTRSDVEPLRILLRATPSGSTGSQFSVPKIGDVAIDPSLAVDEGRGEVARDIATLQIDLPSRTEWQVERRKLADRESRRAHFAVTRLSNARTSTAMLTGTPDKGRAASPAAISLSAAPSIAREART